MRAGVTRNMSPVPSITVPPAAQLVPVSSSIAVPLSLQSPHLFWGCLLLCLPKRFSRGISHSQAKQAWGHTGGPSSPGLTGAAATSRPLFQHISKIHDEIIHGAGLDEQRKSSSPSSSPQSLIPELKQYCDCS